MKSKKEDTKLMLADSFKKLMVNHSFDKITIKMITDEANLIRPSFYNHFADKYEMLEWICYKEIFEGSKLLISNKMYTEAINFIFTSIENHKDFYTKAVKIQGQNSFEEIFCNGLLTIFDAFFSAHDKDNTYFADILTSSDISMYYSKGLTYFISTWLEKGANVSAATIYQKYILLVSNSLETIVLKEF